MAEIKKLAAPKGELAYKNVGFGCTTYEQFFDDKPKIKAGKLYTDTFDREGMSWDGIYWVYDGGLGLQTYLIPLSEVPEEAVNEWNDDDN